MSNSNVCIIKRYARDASYKLKMRLIAEWEKEKYLVLKDTDHTCSLVIYMDERCIVRFPNELINAMLECTPTEILCAIATTNSL